MLQMQLNSIINFSTYSFYVPSCSLSCPATLRGISSCRSISRWSCASGALVIALSEKQWHVTHLDCSYSSFWNAVKCHMLNISWWLKMNMFECQNIWKQFPEKYHVIKVAEMSDEAKEKIRSMQKTDIPIEERRALYNSMARRFRNPNGLKPGLLQKYNACISDQRERFKLLKEFMISEDMSSPQLSSCQDVGAVLFHSC